MSYLMKALKAWVDALKINHVEFQSWCNEVPTSESITYWCLLKHKIQSDEYLSWAKNYFELAALSEEYFEQSPNLEFWNQIHTVANWSPSLLPLTEWDGVVFVGCVEPPEEVHWSFPVQYVLAPAEGLQKFWKQLQKPATTAPAVEQPIIETPTAAATIEPAPPKTQPAESQPTTFDTASLLEDTKTPTASSPPASFEAMEGLNLDLNSFKLEDASPQGTDLSEMPEGINLNVAPVPPEAVLTPDVAPPFDPFEGLETVKSEELDLPDPLQTPASSAPITPEPIAPEPAASETLSPPQTSSQMEDPVTTSNVTSLNRNIPRHESPDDAIIDVKKAPKDLSEAKNENDVIAWGFNKLKEHYKRSMILLFDGEQLRAWKWEKSWAPRTPSTFEAFQLEKPSIFRIVKRSKLPYHGHVVPSEANQEFFLGWGLADLPEQVTALPLCIQDDPIGILLCIGEEGSNTQQALSFSERVATRLTETLSRVHSEAA